MKIGKYIIGIASGLTFGMLFAPKRGKDLRKELMKKSKGSDPCSNCHETFKVLGNAFKEAGEDVWKELKELGEHEQVSAFLELSQEKMRSFLDSAEEKGYDAATMVQEKLEDLSVVAKKKAGEVKKKTSPFKKRRVSKSASKPKAKGTKK